MRDNRQVITGPISCVGGPNNTKQTHLESRHHVCVGDHVTLDTSVVESTWVGVYRLTPTDTGYVLRWEDWCA